LAVEPQGSSAGVCECCGHESRCVWGLIHNEAGTVAAYWAHWTVGRLDDHPGNIDLAVGPWGDETSESDRAGVSLLYQLVDGNPQVMVVDARQDRIGNLASTGLKRDDIIGTPLAEQVFNLVDAACIQDERVFSG
jgi:NADH:ubiquinone oxidoreductase subunit